MPSHDDCLTAGWGSEWKWDGKTCLGCKRTRNADHPLHSHTRKCQEVQEEANEISKLRGTLLANRAACHLQSKRWKACIQVRFQGGICLRRESPLRSTFYSPSSHATGRLGGSRVRSTTRQGPVQTRTGKVCRRIPGFKAKFMCKGVADLSLLSHFLTLIPTK